MTDTVDVEAHRRLGVDLFNRAWALLRLPARTPEQDDEVVHAAHASAYHWARVGTRANRARSEWQCARVYSELGRPEAALHHARRCLELVEAAPAEVEDWDLAAAYEALARAHALAGDREEARRYRDLGVEALARIADPEDRALVEADLGSIRA